RQRTVDGPRGLQLALGTGREQTQVVNAGREAHVDALADLAVEREIRAAESDTHVAESPGRAGVRYRTRAAGCETPQAAADLAEGSGELAARLEASRGGRQHEVEAAPQVWSQCSRIDAARAAVERPALGGRPHDVAADARVAIEQIDLRRVEGETVLAESAARLHG